MTNRKTPLVLENLVRNAIPGMHNEHDRPRVLAISAQLIDETSIEIEVADTGQGFDEDMRRKLFSHGYTTKPHGNGFGLHYCANAVHGSGGHITAESPGLGLGATFRVRLFDVVSLSQIVTA